MSVLKAYFDEKVNQCSPVQDDFVRKVDYDEDGNEFISYEKVDYPTLQKSLGTVNDWSISALLKAGVNPDFPIHTGAPTRIEGISTLEKFSTLADEILAPMNDNEEKF